MIRLQEIVPNDEDFYTAFNTLNVAQAKVARYYLGKYVNEVNVAWHLSFAAVIVDRANNIERITLYPDLFGDGQDIIL